MTQFALIALRGALAGSLLIATWAGAAAGIVHTPGWIGAPEWRVALLDVLAVHRGPSLGRRESRPRFIGPP